MRKFATVRYWLGQLSESGIRNRASVKTSTRIVYLHHLAVFNEWLAGREFDVRVQDVKDGKIVRETVQRSFVNVEELLHFGEDDIGNAKEVRKIISQYLVDPRHEDLSHSTMMVTCAAIKSYFDKHDVMTYVKLNGRKRDAYEVTEEPGLDLVELYKMLTISKIDPMVRAVMLVKFQAGLDSSTLADRFNFYAYEQIAKFCGTGDHGTWGLDKCPIPIRLIRVKTGIAYTTFIDRDALSAVKDYLSWKEKHHGPHDPEGPLFVTTRGVPIHGEWISDAFARLADYSGTQKQLAPNVLKIRSHKMRHLLKTTLVACGCALSVADYVLGHKPDTYIDPDLYQENGRKEYAKASHRINVLSKAASNIDDPEPADAAEKKLKASEARVEELEKRVNELTEANAKKDAVSAGVKAQLEGVVKAIIDASGDPDGDFQKNLRDRLGGLV